VSKTKKIIINIVCSLLLLISGFCTGRFIRFGRASGASQQLITGITSARDDTDKIINELIIAGASAESAAKYGYIISEVIRELQSQNEQLRVSNDEAFRAIENNKRITEIVQSAQSELSNTTGTALEIAIKHAEDYERLIDSLQQALQYSSEDNRQSSE